MKTVRAFAPCAQWGQMKEPHIAISYVRSEARQARDTIAADFSPDKKIGWRMAKSHGWRIRPVFVSLEDPATRKDRA